MRNSFDSYLPTPDTKTPIHLFNLSIRQSNFSRGEATVILWKY